MSRTKIDCNTREILLNDSLIGLEGENKFDVLQIILNKEILKETAIPQIEIEFPNKEKAYIIMNKKDESTAELIIKNSLLTQKGKLKMQFCIYDENNLVFKSKLFEKKVLESINATSTIEEEYPTIMNFIQEISEELQKKVPKIEGYSLMSDSEHEKLEGLENYDDTEVKESIQLNANNISKNTSDIEEMKQIESNIQSTLENHTQEISRQQEELEQLDRDIVNVDNKVTALDEEIQEVESNINYLEEHKASIDDLLNYYLKSETYNKQEVLDLIGQIKSVRFEVVESLPETGDTNVIYLVPKPETSFDDVYNEYIWINDAYEYIGSTQIDLSDYIKDTDYATSTKGGTIKVNISRGTSVANGVLIGSIRTQESYNNDVTSLLLSKGTLENIKFDYIKRALVENTIQLTDEEKLSIENWLGLADTYLTMTNEAPYQVTNNYNPAHKKYVDERISEVELAKFPNMTIIGEPTIQSGQVSNFSSADFMEFPFLVDFNNRPFEINMSFTTGANVTSQENILDSDFGLAFAIRSGKFVIAISSNGTSWNLGEGVGTHNVQANTSYRVKIAWDRMTYKVSYSLDGGKNYIQDINKVAVQSPYPKQMFIGVGKLAQNHFMGIINLNYCDVYIQNELIWQRNG